MLHPEHHTQELQEKTVQLHTLQANSSATESNLRSEHSSANNMVATLKDELEKRLKDIVLLREERDGLQVCVWVYWCDVFVVVLVVIWRLSLCVCVQ